MMTGMLAVVAEVTAHVTSRKQTDTDKVPAAQLVKNFVGIGHDFTECEEDIVAQATERFPNAHMRLLHHKRSFSF